MCYEAAALCALKIPWVLSALGARMYFFISALRGLAISWLSIALCTTITAALQAWRLAGIVPLFLAAEFVRYAISLDYMDYKAAVAVVCEDLKAALVFGAAIGIAPRICLYLLACIVDTHIAISLMITSITVRASTFILRAMKKFRLQMIYQVLAVLCLVILAINVIVAAIFVGVVNAIAIEGYMPSYPWLWVILTSMQACCYLLQCTGAIDGALLLFLSYMPTIFAAIDGILMFFLGYMPTIIISVTFGCIDFLAIVYPWAIKKNYTLRWRRLLLYGGQSYRTILFCFAWLFQARPLYIACFFICLCIMSKLAITSPMKRQLDPLEILRDMPQGVILAMCLFRMSSS